jgi:oxygen-independent coproporphyrinogen-3 oxidase
MVGNGAVSLPDEELIADLYLETIRFFSENGYAHYEISNFALPGGICQHNLKYWKRDLYYGFGLGSHSFDGRERHSNHSLIDAYFASVEAGISPIGWREPVDADQFLSETLFLGLRLTEGINWKELEAAYESNRLAEYKNYLFELAQKGFVEWNAETARLTPSGMLVSNEIFQKFV